MRGARSVAIGILASRVSGLVRESALAFFFGASGLADAWRAALRIPNVLQNLLGEGSLSASFIPVYSELIGEGRDREAREVAGAVLGILAAIAAGLALLGVVSAPVIVAVLVPTWAPELQDVTTALLRVLFPMTGILVVAAWALGILNSHRRFLVSYTAPVLWNLAIIAALLVGGTLAGRSGRALLLLAGWGALAGGGLQLLVQLPALVRVAGRVRPSLDASLEGVRETARNFVPVMTARGVVNLSSILELVLAGLLGQGAVAILGYAQPLYILPISLFGLSIAAAELPELSRDRKAGREVLAPRVRAGLGHVEFWVAPAAVGYLLLGTEAVTVLYRGGDFGVEAATATGWVLAAFALGIMASASSRMLSSAYYALRDTRTPARRAYQRVALSLAIGALVMIPLNRLRIGPLGLGVAGLAVGSSIAAWVEYVLLRRGLTDRIGEHAPALAGRLRIGLSVVAAGAAGLAARAPIASALSDASPRLPALLTLGVFGTVYLVMARGLGIGPGSPVGDARGAQPRAGEGDP